MPPGAAFARSPRTWRVLAPLLALAIVVALGLGVWQPWHASAGSTAQPTQAASAAGTVGATGVSIRLGTLTVSGKPGVAPIGTSITVRQVAEPTIKHTSAAPPVEIAVGGSGQLASPLTLTWQFTPNTTPALAFLTRAAGDDWHGSPVSRDDTRAEATITRPGLALLLDASDIHQAFRGAVENFLNQSFAPPACAGRPLTTPEGTYAVTATARTLSACLEQTPSGVRVTTQSSLPLVLLLSSGSGVAQAALPPEQGPGIAAAALFAALNRAPTTLTAIVPGGHAPWDLDRSVSDVTVMVSNNTKLGVFTALTAGVNQSLNAAGSPGLAGPQLARAGTCAGSIVGDLASSDQDSQTRAILSCAATALGHNGVLDETASFALGVVSSLVGPLAAYTQGRVERLVPPQASVRITRS